MKKVIFFLLFFSPQVIFGASLQIFKNPPVRKIIAGTNITVNPVDGLGEVTINSSLPISVTGAANGDCLIFNSATGYFEPGACGAVVTTAKLLLEDGTNLLLEDGTKLLLEQ